MTKSILSAALLLGSAGTASLANAQMAPDASSTPSTAPATKPASVALDQTTPRGTMKMFLTAVSGGDGDTIHKLFATNGEVEQKAIDAVAQRSKSEKGFRDALISKFGSDEAGKLIGEPAQDLARGLEAIDASEEKINGDAATIDAGQGAGEPVRLKKNNGMWQLDAGAFVSDRDPATAQQRIDDMNFASDMMSRFSADILGGKYKNIDDAQAQIRTQMDAAIQQRMMARMSPQTEPSATAPSAPATQPGK